MDPAKDRSPLLKNKKATQGDVLIIMLLSVVICSLILSALYSNSFGELRAANRDGSIMQAFYLAEAGIDKQLVAINSGDLGSAGTFPLGTGIVAAEFNAVTSTITSRGTVNNDVSVIVSATVQPQNYSLSPAAAFNAFGAVMVTGEVVIDGREHDTHGNLLAGTGKYGVSTTGISFALAGDSMIGGNGFAPAKSYNPGSVQVRAGSASSTPEGILGLPPGALDRYKTSSPPSPCVDGIVYFTGNVWDPAYLGTELDCETVGNGILIVHNNAGNALMENVSGQFNGIIIADRIGGISDSTLINGAMYVLSSSGVLLYGDTAQINYSSEALADLDLPNYSVTSWQDVSNRI